MSNHLIQFAQDEPVVFESVCEQTKTAFIPLRQMTRLHRSMEVPSGPLDAPRSRGFGLYR